MSESKGAMRAVDRMVDAIRADEPPEVNWDTVERSLLQRIHRGEGARPAARPSSGLWRVLSFAAAAAIVPLALSLGSQGAAPAATEEIRAVDAERIALAPGASAAAGEHDLGALHTGDAIESTEAAVTFADAGNVRWTLSPDSRLVVRSPVPTSGIGHVVRLERGSLRVEVQPDLVKQGLVDVLAVEAGNTRVAVHGTAFTVTLRDGEVVVDVEHGIVTVGPTGQRGATTGYQLPAGSRAAFSLDGGRRARFLAKDQEPPAQPIAAFRVPSPDVAPQPALTAPAVPPPDADTPAMMDPPLAAPAKSGASTKGAHAAADADKSSTEPAPEPAVSAEPAKPLLTVGSVQATLKRCFLQAHPPSDGDGAKLTAASTFSLQIRADGSVESAKFNPPLPSIQGCAAFVFGGHFAPGASRYNLSIPVNVSQ